MKIKILHKFILIAICCLTSFGCATKVNDIPVRTNIVYDIEYHIRKFAMLNHSRIAIDMNSDKNDYLLALADLMSSKMSRSEAINVIREALDISKGDQLAFGSELINSFRQQSPRETIVSYSSGGEHLNFFRYDN